jgi:hypothetical protein
MDSQRIVLNDEYCCMKQQIRNFTRFWLNKSLTTTGAILLCIYQITLVMAIYHTIIHFQFVAVCLRWFFAKDDNSDQPVANYIIRMATLFTNIVLILQVTEHIQEFIRALRCNCENFLQMEN